MDYWPTRIARLATEEAIRDRERTSQDHPIHNGPRRQTPSHQRSQVRLISKNQTIFRRPRSRHSLNEPGMKTTKNFFLGVDVLQMKTGKPVARQVSKAW
jgi:hypothetical protein